MPPQTPQPLEPGDRMPPFQLPDLLHDNWFASGRLRGRLGVIVFWSAACHWCDYLASFFAERSARWGDEEIILLLVASNANDTEAELITKARSIGYGGHLLRDKEHVLANAFGAITTPHSFVVDRGGMIVYQGGVNNRTFHKEPTTNYLDQAVESLRRGVHPDPAETPAYGCVIVRSLPT